MLACSLSKATKDISRKANGNTLFFWCIIHVTIIAHAGRYVNRGEAAYIPSAKARGFTRPLITALPA
jgi:hypothetical protein